MRLDSSCPRREGELKGKLKKSTSVEVGGEFSSQWDLWLDSYMSNLGVSSRGVLRVALMNLPVGVKDFCYF